MKNTAVLSAVLFIAAIGISQTSPGQISNSNTRPTATPTPTPRELADEVVRISTEVVQLDVTVTDSKGNVIRDLRQDEIEIYENGKKRSISGFSFISGTPRAPASQPANAGSIAIPEPPRTIRPDQARRVFAILVDDLRMSFRSVYDTRRSVKKFVDEQMQDGDLVAILRTSAGMGALQQFTTDKRLLNAAIERIRWNPASNVSVFAPMTAGAGTDPTGDEGLETSTTDANERIDQLEDFRQQSFSVGTLGAMRFVVRGMREMPGRKSVVLFSDGFPIISGNATLNGEPTESYSFLRALAEEATRSSVVFYAIDPRGLVVTGLTAEDNVSGRSREEIQNTISARNEELSDTQYSLTYLARETGGYAVINDNDTIGALRRVIDDNSYYLVAYDPGEETFDPAKRRFNQIEVKVLRPNTRVRYRSGFLNVADRDIPKQIEPQMNASRALIQAVMSPFGQNGLNVGFAAVYLIDDTGPIVRSMLHIPIDQLKFSEEPDGKRKATFELLAMNFGDNGAVADHLIRSYTITIGKSEYEEIRREGVVYNFAFPVKKPGAYQYRVALRDAATGQIGSVSQFIQVPDRKQNRLHTSGLILQRFTNKQWRANQEGDAPGLTTSVRRVPINSVLTYGYAIYNAKNKAPGGVDLRVKARVFRDGELVLDGVNRKLDPAAQTDLKNINVSGSFAIGAAMRPGEYVLQVIVTDMNADPRRNIATQFITFDVVQ